MRTGSAICVLTDEYVHALHYEGRGRQSTLRGRAQQPCQLPSSLCIEHDSDELAEHIAQAMKADDCPTHPVTLVLPLQWCFTHILETPAKRPTYQAFCFDFEQYLPLPLEELTCAFLPGTDGRVLGVAVPTQPMQDLLAALSQRGVEVEHLAVDVLTASTALRSSAVLADARWLRLLATGAESEPMELAACGRWSEEDGSIQQVTAFLENRGLTDGRAPKHWTILDLTGTAGGNGLREVLDKTGATVESLSTEDSVEALAAPLAVAPPALDLRTHALAGQGRRQSVASLAQQCVLCALALVVLTAGGMYLHTRALRQNIATVDVARLAVYRQVFDVGTLPPGAALRLASERVRLQGLTQSATTTPVRSEAPVQVFREFVACLPEDVRVLLLDVRLDQRQLTLRGQTTGHRDAERIVEALNRVPGVIARPPRTTRLKTGGVEFSIIATGGKQE